MNYAADDHAYIRQRMDEIRSERERASGVTPTPLPEVKAEAKRGEDDLYAYAFC